MHLNNTTVHSIYLHLYPTGSHMHGPGYSYSLTSRSLTPQPVEARGRSLGLCTFIECDLDLLHIKVPKQV